MSDFTAPRPDTTDSLAPAPLPVGGDIHADLASDTAHLERARQALLNADAVFRAQVRETVLGLHARHHWCDAGANALLDELGLDRLEYHHTGYVEIRVHFEVSSSETDRHGLEQLVRSAFTADSRNKAVTVTDYRVDGPFDFAT